MSKRTATSPPGSRPKRQVKAVERFAFGERDGYSSGFRETIKRQMLKDVDEDWDEDLSSGEEAEAASSEELFNSADAAAHAVSTESEEESSVESDASAQDSDEYIGEADSDLDPDEIVDLGRLSEQEESEEEPDESDGYEAADSSDD